MSKIKYFLASIVVLTFLLLLIPEKYEEIETKHLLSGSGPISQIYATPNNHNPLCIQNANPNSPIFLNIDYSQNISFDKISMYFPGNTVNVTSFAPLNFLVTYKTSDTNWTVLNKVNGNTKPNYQVTFENTKNANSFQIQVTRPLSKDTDIVCFSDLKFYRLQKSNFFEKLSNFVAQNHRKFYFYIIYYLVFLSFLFIPGYTLLNLIKSKTIEGDLMVILSPIVSMGILMTLTIFHLLTGIKLFLDLYLLIFVGSLIVFIKDGLYKKMFASKEVFITIVVSIFTVFCVIAKRDYMFNLQYIGTYFDGLKTIPMEGYVGYFVDNFFPWGIARLYLSRSALSSAEAQNLLLGTTIFERTPGLPLILTPILRIFGESHQIYQRFIETLVGIYFGGIYVLAKKVFSKKTALVTILLILLNIQLLYIDFNAELFYKYIATYPALIALILFDSNIKKKDFFIATLLGLSFLIHPSTLVVSTTFGCAYILKYKISKELVKKVFPTTLIVGTLFSIWVIAPKIVKLDEFKERKTSLYFEEVLNIDENIVKAKISNFIVLFYPNPHLKDGNSTFKPLSKDHRFQILRYSIVSNLTPLVFIATLYFMIKDFKKDYLLISFIVLPLATYWLVYLNRVDQYYNYGAAYFLLYPFVVPIALIYTADKILKMKSRIIKKVILVSYILFMALNFYIISGVFRKDLIFPSPLPHLLTFCITLVFLGLSGVLIFALDKND